MCRSCGRPAARRLGSRGPVERAYVPLVRSGRAVPRVRADQDVGLAVAVDVARLHRRTEGVTDCPGEVIQPRRRARPVVHVHVARSVRAHDDVGRAVTVHVAEGHGASQVVGSRARVLNQQRPRGARRRGQRQRDRRSQHSRDHMTSHDLLPPPRVRALSVRLQSPAAGCRQPRPSCWCVRGAPSMHLMPDR